MQTHRGGEDQRSTPVDAP